MAKKFFDTFDKSTLTKLEMYKSYIRKWIPTFLADKNSFANSINIYDFFAGQGRDSKGKKGSPLIAIEALMEYKQYFRPNFGINVILNEKDKKNFVLLQKCINDFDYDDKHISVKFYNDAFVTVFKKELPIMKKHNTAKLAFMDQFGVKQINKKVFVRLVKLPVTDILFFISSYTFYRFSKDKNIKKIIDLTPEEVKKTKPTRIHELVTKKYQALIPRIKEYYLAPFSIKKGKNYYGLIFGSSHLRGIEKFLKTCWESDKHTGTANFNIEADKAVNQQNLFSNKVDEYTKIETFQRTLKEKILAGKLTTDLNIYFYMIEKGFLAKHVRPVIKDLKKEKRIILKHPSFTCKTVTNKDRNPKKIILKK